MGNPSIGTLRIVKVMQQGHTDCGVACLAMATGISYGEAKAAFDANGLSARRGRKPAYASNFKELIGALAAVGVIAKRRIFTGWARVTGISIIKTNVRSNGDWHWVVAYRHAERGIVLMDPAFDLPCFEHPPLDVFYMRLDRYTPEGSYIELSS